MMKIVTSPPPLPPMFVLESWRRAMVRALTFFPPLLPIPLQEGPKSDKC